MFVSDQYTSGGYATGEKRYFPLAVERVTQLERKAGEVVAILLEGDAAGAEFNEQLQAVHHFGREAMRRTAEGVRRGIQRDDGNCDAQVAGALERLRYQSNELDPARHGDLLAPRRLFGLIPVGGNRLDDYFAGYHNAQRGLNRILQDLYRGQDELRKDLARIDREKTRLREAIEELRQYVHLGESLDQRLEPPLARLEGDNPQRATLLRDRFLFPLRQRIQEMQTQLTVSMQGWMALELTRNNNLELIKGVDRAAVTTVSALRTAVLAADALTRQQLALDLIRDTAARANSAMAAASEGLRGRRQRRQSGTSDGVAELARLKTAFTELRGVMDEVDRQHRRAGEALQEQLRGIEAGNSWSPVESQS